MMQQQHDRLIISWVDNGSYRDIIGSPVGAAPQPDLSVTGWEVPARAALEEMVADDGAHPIRLLGTFALPSSLALLDAPEAAGEAAQPPAHVERTSEEGSEDRVPRLDEEVEARVASQTAQLRAANAVKDQLLLRERMARAEAEAASRARGELLDEVRLALRASIAELADVRADNAGNAGGGSEPPESALIACERRVRALLHLLETPSMEAAT